HSEPPRIALWYGLFHSVSAFNSAGFDLFGGFRSLADFQGDTPLLLLLTVLIILGGLGYAVAADLWRVRRFSRLTLDTKLILGASAGLWLAGGAGFFALEASNSRTLGELPLPEALVQAWFFTVSPRSAGFATLNVGDFRAETLLLLVGLMFVGGAP